MKVQVPHCVARRPPLIGDLFRAFGMGVVVSGWLGLCLGGGGEPCTGGFPLVVYLPSWSEELMVRLREALGPLLALLHALLHSVPYPLPCFHLEWGCGVGGLPRV